MSETETETATETPAAPPKGKKTLLRLAVLGALLVGAWVVAEQTGLRDALTQEGIRQMVEDAGPLGAVAYLLAFAVGQLAQLPGMAFVLAARVAYGPWLGFLAGYAGALGAVTLSFFVVRAIGGQALGEVKHRWARRVLAKLDARPIRTVVLLRSVLALSPALNYALAMSRTRFRDYFVGSAIGLVAPVAAWVLLSDCLLGALS